MIVVFDELLLVLLSPATAPELEDGAELPILRANALVRAVVVPAGTHLVTFSYRTPLLRIGAWATLAGIIVCLGFLAQGYRHRTWNGM